MSKTRIGETVVADGATIKWGTLFSVIGGSALYAYFNGVIRVVETIGAGLLTAVEAPFAWLLELINLEVSTGVGAIRTSWWTFYGSVSAAPGGIAWFVSVLAVMLVLLGLFILLKKGVAQFGL